MIVYWVRLQNNVTDILYDHAKDTWSYVDKMNIAHCMEPSTTVPVWCRQGVYLASYPGSSHFWGGECLYEVRSTVGIKDEVTS